MSVSLPVFFLLAVAGASPGGSGPPIVLTPELPPPQEPSELHEAAARRAYEATRGHFERGELDDALRAADEAFGHVPNANTALVRARVLAGLGRCREAFEGLLLTLDLKPTADERVMATQDLARLGPTCPRPLGWARIEVRPAGASLRVGGVSVAPGRAVGLPSGTYTFVARAAGHEPAEAEISIVPGRPAALALSLAKVPDPPKPPLPPPVVESVVPEQAPETAETDNEAAWWLLGGGAALLAGGVGTHVWALGAADDASAHAEPVPGESAEEQEARIERYDSAHDSLALRRGLTIGLYAAGAVAAGIGVLLLLDGESAEQSSVELLPFVCPGGGGFQVKLGM